MINIEIVFRITATATVIFFMLAFILLIGSKTKAIVIGVVLLSLLFLTAGVSSALIYNIGNSYDKGVEVDAGKVLNISDKAITIRSDNSSYYSTVSLDDVLYNSKIDEGRYKLLRFGNGLLYTEYYFIGE